MEEGTKREEGPEGFSCCPHNVLWTSGWDSTYLVVDLVDRGHIVQPWYVALSVDYRPSEKTELARMRQIKTMIEERGYPGEVRPLRLVQKSSLPHRPDLLEAAATVRREHGTFPRQYAFLAALADVLETPLEIGVHKGDNTHGRLDEQVKRDPATGEFFFPPDGDPDLLRIFRRMSFPIFGVDKHQMGADARARGFGDIMETTWFCSTPLFGRPCGHCVTCLATQRQGMGERVGKPTRLKYLGHRLVWFKTRNRPEVLRLRAYRLAVSVKNKIARILTPRNKE